MVDKAKGKPPAPDADNGKLDNNKRLAFLESRLEPLIAAVTTIIATVPSCGDIILAPKDENEDLFDLQIRLLGEIAPRLDQLVGAHDLRKEKIDRLAETIMGLDIGEPSENEGAVDTAIRLLNSGGAQVKAIGAHLAEHYPAVAEAGGTLAEMVIDALATPPPPPSESEQAAKVAELEAEVADLKAQLEAAQSAPAAKGPKAKAKSLRARKCGPVKRDPAAIGAALDSGAPLEIVLSDGAFEIVDFEPYEVAASHFRRHTLGQLLVPTLTVRGANGPRTIRGFGLFAGGRQVAFCPHDPVELAPGQSRGFSKAVFF